MLQDVGQKTGEQDKRAPRRDDRLRIVRKLSRLRGNDWSESKGSHGTCWRKRLWKGEGKTNRELRLVSAGPKGRAFVLTFTSAASARRR